MKRQFAQRTCSSGLAALTTIAAMHGALDNFTAGAKGAHLARAQLRGRILAGAYDDGVAGESPYHLLRGGAQPWPQCRHVAVLLSLQHLRVIRPDVSASTEGPKLY